MYRSVCKFTIIASLALTLTTACQPAASPTAAVSVTPTDPALPTSLPPSVEPTPTAIPATVLPPYPAELPTTIPMSIDPPAVGNLLFPNATPQEGYLVVEAGQALFVTWETAPSGGNRYEFTLYPHDDSAPIVIGVDHDASDGVSVLWLVPSQLTGFARATAYMPDGANISSLSEAISTTATTIPISNDPPAMGSLLFPVAMSLEGYVAIQAGESLSITWADAPKGGSRYEFNLYPYDDSAPLLLGVDDDARDGVRVLWQVPPQLTGILRATAYLPNGITIASFGEAIATGEAPPVGVCTLRNLTADPYSPARLALEPNANSPIFGYLPAGVYVQILGYTADGWQQVEATNAFFETPPPQPAPTSGWLSPETRTARFGPCEALPLVEN